MPRIIPALAAAVVGALLGVGITTVVFVGAADSSASRGTSTVNPTSSGPTPRTSTVPPTTPLASSSSITKRLDAPLRLTDTKRVTRVLALDYRARAGERRLVSAEVVGDQPSGSQTRQTGILVQLACIDSTGTRRVSQSITNVETGGRARQVARMLFSSGASGRASCDVTARLYGEETDRGHTSEVVISPESAITVSPASTSWAREWTRDHPQEETYVSALLRPGQTWTAAPTRTAVVPQGQAAVLVQSDHKITVCYFRGGSSDGTTPLVIAPDGSQVRQNLCEANPLAAGSVVRSRIDLTRLTDEGTPCAPPVVAIDETFWVGGRQHHARINSDGTVVLPAGSDCGRRVQLKSWVENVPLDAGEGLDLVVHAPDERLALLPSR